MGFTHTHKSEDMIVVIDYWMGNAQSVMNALESLGANAELTNDKKKISKASHIILPGVGAFPTAMDNLKKLDLIDLLTEQVMENKKPFLGICLGMQLLAKKGYEGEVRDGLGWIDGKVKKLEPNDKKLKIPHIGWNDVQCNTEKKIFKNSNPIQTFYFVHSYYADCKNQGIVAGTCDYGMKFAAVIEQDNIFGTQFHPEKSQKDGLDILGRFIKL